MPTLPVPANFSFHRTIYSHGWFQLAPFAYDEKRLLLTRVHRLKDGPVVRLSVSDAMHASGYEVVYFGVEGLDVPSPDQEEELRAVVSRILSLDWDLRPFYAAMQGHPGYEWVEAARVGRIMVSPTVWEDLAKTLLTTNTTWSQTLGMVQRLCVYGDACDDGSRTFPTPQQVAAVPVDALDAAVRAGYRSEYLHRLASDIASGKLDVEAWHASALDSGELYRAIRALRGFGDYAAGTMLRLLGRFDRVPIDSVCRAVYKEVTGSQTDTNAEILAYYEPFGEWRGLAMWMDAIREYGSPDTDSTEDNRAAD